MTVFYFILSVILLITGHIFRLLRWEQFIRIYERPSHGYLLTAMTGGYAINFFLPFHAGDVFRAVYCGRKMRSGTGFGFSTVIMDRFLDVWFVTFFFVAFRLTGNGASPLSESYYLRFSLILVLVMVIVLLLRDPLKRLCLLLSGIFNDSIKLDVMTFLWSLINIFKDLLRVNIGRLLLNTVLMWGAYIGSYAAVAECLTRAGTGSTVFDIFRLLFESRSITRTTLTAAIGTGDRKTGILLIAWLVTPLALMFLVTLLPRKMKDAISSVTGVDSAGDYENLLPQTDPADRQIFLSRYFGLENREYLTKFLEINRNISIIQDYSAGSNATTMLCMDADGTFFRKYAFGADGKKLAEQLQWLKRYREQLPLCTVLRDSTDELSCWYDMTYDPSAVDFFRFIHSHPIEESVAILHSILESLRQNLYAQPRAGGQNGGSPDECDRTAETSQTAEPSQTAETRESAIDRYIETKILANLDRLQESRTLKELLNCEELIINGVSCRNLSAVKKLFQKEKLRGIFASDPISPIHGDLTVENIICRLNEPGQWYLIDPNGGNIHDSPFLDYAKLMQSLHGSYEFMMMTPVCRTEENRIDFQLTRSAAYDMLFDSLKTYIISNYGKEGYRSVCMHELAHWLRLLPYKLAKDRKRAPMFYAGFIMVANAYMKDFPEEI